MPPSGGPWRELRRVGWGCGPCPEPCGDREELPDVVAFRRGAAKRRDPLACSPSSLSTLRSTIHSVDIDVISSALSHTKCNQVVGTGFAARAGRGVGSVCFLVWARARITIPLQSGVGRQAVERQLNMACAG